MRYNSIFAWINSFLSCTPAHGRLKTCQYLPGGKEGLLSITMEIKCRPTIFRNNLVATIPSRNL